MTSSRSLSERAYAWLVRLYPRAFRARFGADMEELFRDQCRTARKQRLGLTRLWLRTVPASGFGALLEHFGSADRATLRLRTGDNMLQRLVGDLRFAVRMLRKSPVFVAIAVLVIALGTGAVTTIFSAANAIALRPLPGAAAPDRLIEVRRSQGDSRGSLSASYFYYSRLRERARTVSGVAAWSMQRLTIAIGPEGQTALGNLVSDNYFAVLGVKPALGRFFMPDEAGPKAASQVVVLSHALWRRRLDGDSAVVGRTITLNGSPFTVIGVAPPAFQGVFSPVRTDAWVPIAALPGLRPRADIENPGAGWLELFARLRDGVSKDQAQAELSAVTAAVATEGTEPPDFRIFRGVRLTALTGLPDEVHGAVLGFMGLLLAAAGLVLLIASVNVAAMLLARAASRRREMALRVALGAGRRRLVAQILTESVLLFALGAVGGVLIATQATRILERLPLPVDIPLSLDLAPDARVLGFALIVALMTGLAFGLGPALQASRVDLTDRLYSDSAGAGSKRSRLRSSLVVGQMALSLLLLVTAGLFVKALERGHNVDPGFDPSNVTVLSFDLQASGYDEPKARAFYRELGDRVNQEPGVVATSFARFLPLSLNNMGTEIQIDGTTPQAAEREHGVPVSVADVGVRYFEVLRIPVMAGRAFLPSDDEHGARVAIVNQTLARRYWPNGSAVGHTIREGTSEIAIVGEVADSKYMTLSEEPTPFVYFPRDQRWSFDGTLMVRTRGPAGPLPSVIRSIVRSLDPALPIPAFTTLEEATAIVLLPQRVAAYITGSFGLLGLLLAALGLYGIIAYSVSQRTREIGVRMALGADRVDVLRLVVREGMRLVGAGIAIGLVLALAVTPLVRKLLFDVSPIDGATFVAMSLLLAGVAWTASYLPARRAAAADPTATLRHDG